MKEGEGFQQVTAVIWGGAELPAVEALPPVQENRGQRSLCWAGPTNQQEMAKPSRGQSYEDLELDLHS